MERQGRISTLRPEGRVGVWFHFCWKVELQVGVVESALGNQIGVGLGPQDVLRG